MQFIDGVAKTLAREINDLDDIRLVMGAMRDLRQNEIRIEMSIGPIEDSYAMLQRYNVSVQQEDVERCDTLRYSWRKVLATAQLMASRLLELQERFRQTLATDLVVFNNQCTNYCDNYRKVSVF